MLHQHQIRHLNLYLRKFAMKPDIDQRKRHGKLKKRFSRYKKRPQFCLCGQNRVPEMIVYGKKQYSCSTCKFFMRETDFEHEFCECNICPVAERCDKQHYLSWPKFKYSERCRFKENWSLVAENKKLQSLWDMEKAVFMNHQVVSSTVIAELRRQLQERDEGMPPFETVKCLFDNYYFSLYL